MDQPEEIGLFSETGDGDTAGPAARKALLIQFPRRVLLLLLSLAAAVLLIFLSISVLVNKIGLTGGIGLGEMIGEAQFDRLLLEVLPRSMGLMALGLLASILIALISTAAGTGAQMLEKNSGIVGSLIWWAGKLLAFALAAAPPFVLGLLLVMIFAIQLGWFPAMGLQSLVGDGGIGSRLKHLALPALALALLPALIAAQSTARWLTLPRTKALSPRILLGGLAWLLGALFGQTGGMLSALVLVETVFNLPGIGRLFTSTFATFKFPALLGCLLIYALLIFFGRMLSELLYWAANLIDRSSCSTSTQEDDWRRTARRIWMAVGALALLLVLIVFISGLAVSADEVNAMQTDHAREEPSDEFAWGTDALGRDLKSRAMRGAMNDLGMATVTVVLLLIPAALGGVLIGFLKSKGGLLWETLADLALFPADVLLYIPALPGAAVLGMIFFSREGYWMVSTFACSLLLLPRAVRVFPELRQMIAPMKKILHLAAAGGAAILSIFYAAFLLVLGLNFIGLSVQPPTASLGMMIAESTQMMAGTTESAVRLLVLTVLCSMCLYLAADAASGFFSSKDSMARLNS